MQRDIIFLAIGITASIFLSGPFAWVVRVIWFRWKRRISWRSFYSRLSSSEVRAAIEEGGQKPDIIVGVNSGIVPAAILAYNYQVDTLRYILSMPAYNAAGNRLSQDIELSGLDIRDKYVLIVDDQYYSGDTMRAVRERVEQLPGADRARIRTFAVFVYDTPARPVCLDIQPPGKVRGILAKSPWAFSQEIERHYLERTRKDIS